MVKKRQKDISDIDQKIISMYAKGITTRQISDTLDDIYGFEASEGFISDVTDKIMPQIEDWQNRPLSEIYPVLYIDAIHYSVQDNGVCPIFKFSTAVRKVIYTTNAIESLNATYRKLNRQRSVFPSDTALLKALYLSTFEATRKWSMPIRNWGQVYGELSIMYEGRLPE